MDDKVKKYTMKGIRRYLLLVLLTSGLLSCEQADVNQKQEEAVSDKFFNYSEAIDELHKKQKYDVNERVKDVFIALKNNMETEVEKEKIYNEHKVWLALREDKCVNEKLDEDIPLQESIQCLKEIDENRGKYLINLNVLKILKKPLLEIEPPPVSNVSYDLKKMSVYKMAVNKNNSVVALFDSHRKNGDFLHLMDLNTGSLLHTIPGVKPPYMAEFSSNGRVLFISSYKNSRSPDTFKLVDVESGKILLELTQQITHFAQLNNGEQLVYAEGKELAIYDFSLGDTKYKGYGSGNDIKCLEINNEQNRVVSAGRNQITLWAIDKNDSGRMEVKREQKLDKKAGNVTSCELTDKTEKLIIQTSSKELYIYKHSNLRFNKKVELDKFNMAPHVLKNLKDDVVFVYGREYGNDVRATHTLFLDAGKYSAKYVDDIANNAISVFEGEKVLYVYKRVLKSVDSPIDMLPLTMFLNTEQQKKEERIALNTAPAVLKLKGDFLVEAIGVYEGQKPEGMGPWWAEKTEAKRQEMKSAEGFPVTVKIGATEKPVVLVLASHDAVTWKIKGLKPKQILIAGSQKSKVSNGAGAEVTYIGSSSSYKVSGSSYSKLNKSVMNYAGKKIDRFQGNYTGNEFMIGKSNALSTEIIKKVNEDGSVEFTDKK